MTAKPCLFTFGVSHYCEKARWALEWHGVDFNEVRWPPGPHFVLARVLGAPASSLPILRDGEAVIQGSDRIIDWAEQVGTGPSLTPERDPSAALQIERRADQVLGVHVRRLFYAETLTDHPDIVKSVVFDGVSPLLRVVGGLLWPLSRRGMIAMMDARPEAAPDSRMKIEGELDWLESTLTAGGGFFAENRFSRADLTVASLVAPFAQPKQMELYRHMSLPPSLAEVVEAWRDRPVMSWARSIYQDYRRPRHT